MPEDRVNFNEPLLVLRCQAGDKSAFDELLTFYQMRLWRYLFHTIGDRELAEDVLQDVFLIIYRKIGWLSEPKLFRPWAYRIASREAFRALRKRSRYRAEPLDEQTLETAADDPGPAGLGRELVWRLPAIIKRVSPASRPVLVLHYLEGLSISETADVLDISPGTVRSRLAYGLAALRRELKAEVL